MRRIVTIASTLAAAMTVAAVPLAGAPRPTPVAPHHVARRSDPVDPGRAAALRARAADLARDRKHFRQAAGLFERAAALTPVEDAARAHDLYLAANLFWDVGSPEEAQAEMAQSADAALERGDVEAAADAFVSAAWVAAKRGQAEDARAYALRALHLAASPLISDELRDRIRQRVVVSPEPEKAATGECQRLAHTGFSVAAQRARAGTPRPVRRPLKAEAAAGSGR